LIDDEMYDLRLVIWSNWVYIYQKEKRSYSKLRDERSLNSYGTNM